ncbi:hypothetical protein BC833DRAFT_624409 [Globomyces pollinis-pini]|nr:hypothetical protein BC833DRAFT_624409 [Globomyces pollinis-pini]
MVQFADDIASICIFNPDDSPTLLNPHESLSVLNLHNLDHPTSIGLAYRLSSLHTPQCTQIHLLSVSNLGVSGAVVFPESIVYDLILCISFDNWESNHTVPVSKNLFHIQLDQHLQSCQFLLTYKLLEEKCDIEYHDRYQLDYIPEKEKHVIEVISSLVSPTLPSSLRRYQSRKSDINSERFYELGIPTIASETNLLPIVDSCRFDVRLDDFHSDFHFTPTSATDLLCFSASI